MNYQEIFHFITSLHFYAIDLLEIFVLNYTHIYPEKVVFDEEISILN